MANYTWDHIHLRTTNPRQWRNGSSRLGAEVVRTARKGRASHDFGANSFTAPETGVNNSAPMTPYRGLDILLR